MHSDSPKIVRIEIDISPEADITYFFADNPKEPVSSSEFRRGTRLSDRLRDLENALFEVIVDDEDLNAE